MPANTLPIITRTGPGNSAAASRVGSSATSPVIEDASARRAQNRGRGESWDRSPCGIRNADKFGDRFRRHMDNGGGQGVGPILYQSKSRGRAADAHLALRRNFRYMTGQRSRRPCGCRTEQQHAGQSFRMHDTLIQWAAYWDGSLAWAAITSLFLISGFLIIPRPAICILAGVTFGLSAFPLALIASTAGSVLAFLLARYFFRARFVRMLQRRPKAKLLADAVDAEGWRLLFLLRLASPIPGSISNYAFGLSSIRLLHYMLATAVGITPQVFAFVYLGAIAKVAIDDGAVSSTKLMFGITGFIVLLVVIGMVTRRVRGSIRTDVMRSDVPSDRAEFPRS